MNERLNQQVAQLKLERSALTGDMERLRAAQADGQGGGALPQQQGEQGMAREWKVEEIERLRGEVCVWGGRDGARAMGALGHLLCP